MTQELTFFFAKITSLHQPTGVLSCHLRLYGQLKTALYHEFYLTWLEQQGSFMVEGVRRPVEVMEKVFMESDCDAVSSNSTSEAEQDEAYFFYEISHN